MNNNKEILPIIEAFLFAVRRPNTSEHTVKKKAIEIETIITILKRSIIAFEKRSVLPSGLRPKCTEQLTTKPVITTPGIYLPKF